MKLNCCDYSILLFKKKKTRKKNSHLFLLVCLFYFFLFHFSEMNVNVYSCMQLFRGTDTFWPLGGRSALDFTLQWFRRTGPRPFPLLAVYASRYGAHVCPSGCLSGKACWSCCVFAFKLQRWLLWIVGCDTLEWAAPWRVGRINRCQSRLSHPHSIVLFAFIT